MGKLIAGGDSFTYGSELLDCYKLADPANGRPTPYEVVSNSTYTALIAKELGLEYICTAWPGYSNDSIRRTTMNACAKSEDVEIVIVTWSFPGRYEFRFNSQWEQLSPWSVTDNLEETIKKEFVEDNPIVFQNHINRIDREKQLGITDFASVFYNKIGAFEYWETYNSLTNIVMLQQYLKQLQIKYLFSAVDECIIKNAQRHTDDTIRTLADQVDQTNWFWFGKDQGFYTWAKEQKFPFATTHPREEAHIEAANLIYEHIRYLGWIS